MSEAAGTAVRAAVAAVDLGATSGRVMLGLVGTDGGIELIEAGRFPNGATRGDGRLAWDVDALWDGIRAGLAAAGRLAREHGRTGLDAIGIDSWAVDYVLTGPDGERIGEAVCYRDDRTEGFPEQVAAQVPRSRQYAITGIAQQVFNTIHQLAADDRLAGAPAGTTALLIPDWVAFRLTGVRRTEVTNASTTGLLDARTRDWSAELLAAIGIDASLFAPLVEPGERIGTVTPSLGEQLGIGEVPVIAVGSHDTASAVAAVPMTDPGAAWISSGTWSLVGLELGEPVTTDDARLRGFTNEAGVGGSIRFLENVMGMWLLSECQREWAEAGEEHELGMLLAQAAAAEGGRFVVDATAPEFLPPGDMVGRRRHHARDPGPGDPLRARFPGGCLPRGSARRLRGLGPRPADGAAHRRRRLPQRAALPAHGRCPGHRGRGRARGGVGAGQCDRPGPGARGPARRPRGGAGAARAVPRAAEVRAAAVRRVGPRGLRAAAARTAAARGGLASRPVRSMHRSGTRPALSTARAVSLHLLDAPGRRRLRGRGRQARRRSV